MSNITLTAPTYFRAGVSGVSAVVGVESGCNRVVRYSFLSPATGASQVRLSLEGLVFGGGIQPASLGFYIGTDAASHINAGPGSALSGQLTGTPFTGTADILLLPEKRYYLFVFPLTADYGWYSLELAAVTLEGLGGSYSVPTLSAERTEMGSSLMIYTNAHDPSFTHTISYAFGNSSGIIDEGVGEWVEWTPPLELAMQIPNSELGMGSVYCTTYQNGTPIGTTQSVTLWLTVPASVKPTVSATWRDTSAAASLGLLTKLVSTLELTLDAAGAWGSTVTASSVTLNGKAYTGGPIMESGTLPLTVTVRDSRGRTEQADYTVTVADYHAPSLTLKASRCLEDGTLDDTGEFCRITLTGETAGLEGRNTATLTLGWGGEPLEIPLETGAFTEIRQVPASSEATLSIWAVLADALLETPRDMVLSVGYATLDLLAGGRGIAFGTTATKEGFECAMDATFAGGLYALADGEMEWLFPPMEEGVEYRTPERYLGRPVYRKLIALGAMPNNATRRVSVSPFSTAWTLVDLEVMMRHRSGVAAMKLAYGGSNASVFAEIGSYNMNIAMVTTADFSAYDGYALIRYTKE